MTGPNDKKRRFSLFPTTLQKAAEAATRPAFKQYGLAQARLTADWPHIVGTVLAGKALPRRIQFAKGQRDGGTLFLDVATGWALEVQHLEPIILDKISTYFGYRAVAKIHITQRPLPLPAPKKAPEKPEKPLPEAEKVRLDTIVAEVTNPELKAALERLGEGIFKGKP